MTCIPVRQKRLRDCKGCPEQSACHPTLGETSIRDRHREHSNAPLLTLTLLPAILVGVSLVAPASGVALDRSLLEDILEDKAFARDIFDIEEPSAPTLASPTDYRLGCLFSADLCNQEETCFNDLLLGRCVSKDPDIQQDEDLHRFEPLSVEDDILLSQEVERLVSFGFTWADQYTQCTLQNILKSIQQRLAYDTEACEPSIQSDVLSTLHDVSRRLDTPKKFVLQQQQLQDQSPEPPPAPEGQPPQDHQSKSLEGYEIIPGDSEENNALIKTSYRLSGGQKRGLGQLSSKYNYPTAGDNGGEEPEVRNEQPSAGFSIFEDPLDNSLVISPDDLKDAAFQGQGPLRVPEETLEKVIDAGPFVWYLVNDLPYPENEPGPGDAIWINEYETYPAQQVFPEDIPELNRGPGGWNEDQRYEAGPLSNEGSLDGTQGTEVMFLPPYPLQGRAKDQEGEFLQRHKFDDIHNAAKRTFVDGVDEEADEAPRVLYQFQGEEESFEYPVHHTFSIERPDDPEYSEEADIPSIHYTRKVVEEPSGKDEEVEVYYPEVGLTSGDESGLFNRNERYDVKKPGPFFSNSANNFFLNKLIASKDEAGLGINEDGSHLESQGAAEATYGWQGSPGPFGSSFGPRTSEVEDEKGQLEVETPILAPVKDKRFLNNFKFPTSAGKAEAFVHIVPKKRLDTWSQGSAFIDMLARLQGLPEDVLSNRRIEDHHVQFRVDANPLNINAMTVVNRLDNDLELRKRLSQEVGVDVAAAATGSRDADVYSIFPRAASPNIIVIAVIVSSTVAALLVAVAVLVLIRRRVISQKISLEKKISSSGVINVGKDQQGEYGHIARVSNNGANGRDSELSPPEKPGSVFVRRIQSQESRATEASDRSSSTSSWIEEPTTTNMDISTGHMVLAYMEDHLKNRQRLEQEWVGLCSYEAEPSSTKLAYKAENKKKNRYPDKLPYDHNRVVLNAVLNASNSDYINASAITDHDPRNPSYIVTQGPLNQTVADFWQMIWEQGCVVIVMLTRLQDNGYQLCQRYWPDEGSEQYHIFEVHLVSEHVWCDDYLVRSVYLKNTRTGETRTVTQFHFLSWPSQSVPSSTKALLEFRRKVNKSYRGRSCPICVHCSDGVGRSGTYVLIDMVLNRMAKGCKEIDIAATLEHIRDQRGGMVQTRPQFEFCLMAVAEEVHAILKALIPVSQNNQSANNQPTATTAAVGTGS